MNDQRFQQLLDRRIELTKKVLGAKALEYARCEDFSGPDRLHNFKKAGRRRGSTAAQALLGFLEKHLVAVDDAVDFEDVVSQAWIDEKIGDVINYYILLEAILTEEMETERQ